MDFQICSTAYIRNPPLPQAGSQTVCLGFGSTTRTAILTTSRGVKNSPFSPTSLLSAKTSKASPMTSLFDFNKLYLSNRPIIQFDLFICVKNPFFREIVPDFLKERSDPFCNLFRLFIKTHTEGG